MKRSLFFTSLLAVSLATLVHLGPNEEEEARLALESPDLFEGDIAGGNFDDDRNAIAGNEWRWPNGVIPYVIDSSLTDKKEIILKGMEHYSFYTCIRFVARTNEENYLKIFKGNGCYSFVGKGKIKSGIGQPLSIGDGCHHIGTIVHELGHAIGFYHEQSRSDRDEYLIINHENIKEGFLNDFKKLKPHENILYNTFDYNSIMIYGNKVFTANGKDTIVAKNGQKLLGPYNKLGMTVSDIERVNKMYKCTFPL